MIREFKAKISDGKPSFKPFQQNHFPLTESNINKVKKQFLNVDLEPVVKILRNSIQIINWCIWLFVRDAAMCLCIYFRLLIPVEASWPKKIHSMNKIAFIYDNDDGIAYFVLKFFGIANSRKKIVFLVKIIVDTLKIRSCWVLFLSSLFVKKPMS